MNHNEKFDQKHALRLAGAMASKIENVIKCGDVMILSEHVRVFEVAGLKYNSYIFEQIK